MHQKRAIISGILITITVMAAGLWLYRDNIRQFLFQPTPSTLEEGVETAPDAEVVAENLKIPWEIAFLPSGDLLVTERPGTLRRIGANGQTFRIEGVAHVGEGGLMGMALHPNFTDNRFIYLYLTTQTDNGLRNRVERYRLSNDRLYEKVEIISGIPGASFHDGGRIAFGPDGMLYITTGDAGQEELAQDTDSLAGKILRIRDDGAIPANNPFDNAVYSYGHRNPQGLAWDRQGRLWITEHGPSGAESGHDELNLIESGANYGWPHIRGDQTKRGMRAPIAHSGADETWAPAGVAFLNGSLYFAGLRGASLYEARLGKDNNVSLKSHFRARYGRLRAVALGPKGQLYISTSNTDGRGNERTGDDKIIKINPAIFNR